MSARILYRPPMPQVASPPYRFSDRDRRKEQRARLLARDPRCQRCQRQLQGEHPNFANYANVKAGALWCRGCLDHLAGNARRRRMQERMDEQAKQAETMPEIPDTIKPRAGVNLVRRRLMALNPHCDHCGKRLQSEDAAKQDTFANVFRASVVLLCKQCLPIVTDLWELEHDPACYLDEWKPTAGELVAA